jgi:DNA-binding MarR family transcriptional regulator
MPTSRSQIDLERFLPYRLSVLSNEVSAAIASAYQLRFDLSVPEWRVIAVLARHAGLSARDVAELTSMDAVAVSRAVRRLLSSDRIRRDVSRSDRRRSVLRLSRRGVAVYRAVAPLALGYEQQLLEGLSAEERQALDLALHKLTLRARSLRQSAGSGQPRRAPPKRSL